MPGWKRVLTILLIVLGPGLVIWWLATHLKNKFIELPYLGAYSYEYNEDSVIVDSTAFVLPDFTLTGFDGKVINRDSIKNKTIVLTTIQPMCPDLDECGMSLYMFKEIVFQEILDNQSKFKDLRVLSILTDENGQPIPEGPSEKLIEEMEIYDEKVWWRAYGDPTPLFSWDYYGKSFMDHPATPEEGEIGTSAFVSSLVLIDKEGHIRGVTGAKKDSDLRNFLDLIRLLKKAEDEALFQKKNRN